MSDTSPTPASQGNRVFLSVSIVTYHCDLALLRRTLESLLESVRIAQQRYPFAVDIVLVSNDELAEWRRAVVRLAADLAAELPACTSLQTRPSPSNVGFSAGHNLAIATTASEYHLVLNPDVVLEPPCLVESLRYLEDQPAVVMCVPQGYDAEGNYACLAKRAPSALVLLLRGLAARSGPRGRRLKGWASRRVDRYVYADKLPAQEPTVVEHASGCYMFCRTQALRQVGGFDERYFMYFEDYDLSRRISALGAIVELPDVRICHYGGRTAQQGWLRIARFLRSGLTYFRQYGWRVA